MSAPSLLCAALEVALNRYLALDEEALRTCAQQQGRVIALASELPDWRFCIEFVGQGVRVFSDAQAPADVSVRGRPATLLRLAWQVGQGESGIPQGLQIDGDTELLRRFNRTLARVGFDPEELLAGYLGDAAAHRVAQGLKTFMGWGRRSAGTLALDTAEYLREETGDLARAADVADWMDQVDRLREGVDRLEARYSRLQQQVEAAAP